MSTILVLLTHDLDGNSLQQMWTRNERFTIVSMEARDLILTIIITCQKCPFSVTVSVSWNLSSCRTLRKPYNWTNPWTNRRHTKSTCFERDLSQSFLRRDPSHVAVQTETERGPPFADLSMQSYTYSNYVDIDRVFRSFLLSRNKTTWNKIWNMKNIARMALVNSVGHEGQNQKLTGKIFTALVCGPPYKSE